MNRLTLWLGSLPTTPLRIVVSLLLITATAARYLVWGIPQGASGQDGWNPWLFFLATLSGIDAAVWTAKRITWKPSPSDDPGAPDVENAQAGATTPAAPTVTG